MNGSEYQVIYDITKIPPPTNDILHWLGGLVLGLIIFASIFFLNKKMNRSTNLISIFGIIWIIGWLGFGGIGFGNVLSQYYKCVGWAKSGNYSVVVGNVSDFKPMPYAGHEDESFSVNGVHFEYSDYDLSKCGFNNSTSHGGPISEGLPVRISYKDGRILILEIKK